MSITYINWFKSICHYIKESEQSCVENLNCIILHISNKGNILNNLETLEIHRSLKYYNTSPLNSQSVLDYSPVDYNVHLR